MNKKPEFRMEHDSVGEVPVPFNAYWGATTARAHSVISNVRVHPRLIDALVSIKKAAASSNGELDRLPPQISRAIIQAADEVLSGQWRDQFVIDSYFASMAAVNANVNEVLASRASEILGGQSGGKTAVTAAQVNLQQSSNDVYPTALRLALLAALKELSPVLLDLERLLRRKSLEFDRVIKIGRAHLQDGLPISLGQEFNAYGSSIERSFRRLNESSQSLLELNLGAGWQGTGVFCDPDFVARTVDRLSQLTGHKFKPAEDYFRLSQSLSDFMEFSSSLKELSIELNKIVCDLRILSSGPRTGFGDIQLPVILHEETSEVLPPVSLPVLLDSVAQVCFTLIGGDSTISLAAQSGQLELNPFSPLVAATLLQSMDLLRNALLLFNQKCLTGIRPNTQKCQDELESSGLLAAVAAGNLGAETARQLYEESSGTGKSVRQLIQEKELLSPELLEKLFHYRNLARPGSPVVE